MNILGFRTNKLWKKILASTYYILYLFLILIVILSSDNSEMLTYGTNQDVIRSNLLNVSILLFFALPIIVLELRYRLKLNFIKTILCSFISFIIWIILFANIPDYSEQYNSYLESKKEVQEVQETELESQESENLLQKIEIKENVNDVIIDNKQENEVADIDEEIETEENVEDTKINEEINLEKIEDTKKDEEVFESIKNKVKESSPVTQNETAENEIVKEVIEETGSEQNTENVTDTQEEIQTENTQNIQNAVIPETNDKDLVWICDTGKKYHSKSTCSNMNYPYQVTKDEAISSERDACKKCYGR